MNNDRQQETIARDPQRSATIAKERQCYPQHRGACPDKALAPLILPIVADR
jgi:hypothetical protein